MRTILLVACLLSACDTEEAPPPATPQVCRLEKLADLPMAPGTPWAIVTGRLNGRPVSMLLDTGDERLSVTPRAKLDIGFTEDRMHRTTVHGIGGDITSNDVMIDRVQLGDMELFQSGAAVANVPAALRTDPPLAGIIGAEIMSQYDMEFNFRQRRVAFWQRTGCNTITPAWQGNWSTTRLIAGEGNLATLTVMLDGHPMRAMLDTGAAATSIDIAEAGRIGMTAESVAASRPGRSRGSDDNEIITHVSPGHDIAVGTARSMPFPLVVGPLHIPFADMLLGADFFRQRDLWISYAGRKAFIQ